MEEDNIYRRMTPHDAARIKRLTQDRGHYTNCRYYIRIKDRSFECAKKGKVKDCNGCFVCPNCSGMMFSHYLKKGHRTGSVFITHSKSCVICGAYIEEHYIGFAEKQRSDKSETQCQVEGCTHTTYEGHEHVEDEQVFKICVSHRNRVRTWKQHPTKGEDQKPLLLISGKLVDNPDYAIKQGKRT